MSNYNKKLFSTTIWFIAMAIVVKLTLNIFLWVAIVGFVCNGLVFLLCKPSTKAIC